MGARERDVARLGAIRPLVVPVPDSVRGLRMRLEPALQRRLLAGETAAVVLHRTGIQCADTASQYGSLRRTCPADPLTLLFALAMEHWQRGWYWAVWPLVCGSQYPCGEGTVRAVAYV